MASEERSRRDSRSRGPHGPGPMRGPVEHAKDARGTFRRLLAYIKPEGPKFVFVLLCILMTFIGGLIPSRKAAKQDPVLALRSE